MTVLRARALNVSGQPVAGRTAVLSPYEAKRYDSPYVGGPSRSNGLSATSGADGWMQWTLPDPLRKPGPKGFYWVITGLEAQPVVAATRPGDGTVTLDARRVGTVDTAGALVPSAATPAGLDTLAEVAASLKNYVSRADLDEPVTAADVPFVPAAGLVATDVQAAIEAAAAKTGTARGARLHRTTNQATGTGETEIDFSTQTWAHGGMTTDIANNQIIAPVKGLYQLSASVRFYGGTASDRLVIPRVNYTGVAEFSRTVTAGYEGNVAGSLPVPMNAGDVVTVNVYTGGAAAGVVGTASGVHTWVALALLGLLP